MFVASSTYRDVGVKFIYQNPTTHTMERNIIQNSINHSSVENDFKTCHLACTNNSVKQWVTFNFHE